MRIMAKVLRELALLTSMVAAGIALLLLAGLHMDYGGVSSTTWGYPLPWRFQTATGFTSLSAINWLSFGEDLVFWLALSVAAVETTSRIAVPYLKRKLEIRRSRQTTGSTHAIGRIQTPNGTA